LEVVLNQVFSEVLLAYTPEVLQFAKEKLVRPAFQKPMVFFQGHGGKLLNFQGVTTSDKLG